MKLLSILLPLILSTASFAADGTCKVGIDTDGLNDARTAVVQSMAKQLVALGCTVGSPESHTSAASAPTVTVNESNSAACTSGQVLTSTYGCITSAGSCVVAGVNAPGVIYNNTCVAVGNPGPTAPSGYYGYGNSYGYVNGYPTFPAPSSLAPTCTTGQIAVVVNNQVTCLSQSNCNPGQASYNGQCYNLSPSPAGSVRSNGFSFPHGY